MTTQQIILVHGVATFLLALTISFTRATFLRVVGASAAGVAVGRAGVGADVLGSLMGWWYYPMVDTPYAPLWMYTVAALWYGAGVALIGWRVTRRFGWHGQLAFLGVMAIYGPVRDYAAAAASGMLVFGPGIAPVLADLACWVGLMGLAQLVMRLVSGPARSDRLARLPTPGDP